MEDFIFWPVYVILAGIKVRDFWRLLIKKAGDKPAFKSIFTIQKNGELKQRLLRLFVLSSSFFNKRL